jgi:N-acetylneuraminic acid mutarotase
MKCSRSNFALTVVDNMVYVFGGIQNKGSGHAPIMPSIVAEKYDPIQDKWETVEIAGAQSIGAFGWTTLGSPEKLLIVGGTDGEMLQDTCMIVDFKEGKATN